MPENKLLCRLRNALLKAEIWRQVLAQDLIEYALMAGFISVAAGAVMPNVANQIISIMNVVNNTLTSAAGQASSAAS